MSMTKHQDLGEMLAFPSPPFAAGMSYRQLAALHALQGILADPESHANERRENETCSQATARLAVQQADDLIRCLANTEQAP